MNVKIFLNVKIDNRDVNLEQFRGDLEAQLDDYPCVKHIFWEPFLTVRDMYCALQIRADAFNGSSQRAKRITTFCEFGCASANKGGRRDMDEMTFDTHVTTRTPLACQSRAPHFAHAIFFVLCNF